MSSVLSNDLSVLDHDLEIVGDVGLSEVEEHQPDESLTTYLFNQILDAIADWDPFLIKTAPSIFVVYAHESKDGQAMAEISEKLISWLKSVRAGKLRSDKSPLGIGLGFGTTLDAYYENAAHNILSNQLCLLPRSTYEKSVDKVILCCSEALWKYYRNSISDSNLRGYSETVKNVHSTAPKQPKKPEKLHSELEKVIKKHEAFPTFHHVLTELVFLDIRKQEYKDNSGVIPIILNETPKIYQSMPGYVEGTDLYITSELESGSDPSTGSTRKLHNLFFKLMGRLLPHDDRIIRAFKTCYNECTTWLAGGGSMSQAKAKTREEFKSHVNIEIFKLLYRLGKDLTAVGRTNRKDVILKDLWNVPFDRNDRFIGRETELGLLAEMLSSKDRRESAAVYGLGGAGKSQLVLEFAYRKRERFPGCSIFWVSAINSTTFITGYLEMGEKLQIPGIAKPDLNPTALIKAVKEKLSDESSGQWLLIIDNVDLFDVLNEEPDGSALTGSLPLLVCLPKSPQGSILFTTRNRRVAYDLARENKIEVAAMDLTQARDLLHNWVFPKTLLDDDESDGAIVDKLLELLTRLPLAIVQAGAYMTREEETASNYVARYEESERDALKLLSNSVKDEGGDKTIKNPVAVTWRISFDQIQRKDEVAARFLSSMACLFHQNIPQELLPRYSGGETKEAIATLKAYSFVTDRNPGGPYDMQPLVHLVTQQWLKDQDDQKENSIAKRLHNYWYRLYRGLFHDHKVQKDRHEMRSLEYWTKQTILQIAEVYPSEQPENMATWNEYLPHATHALFLPHTSDENQEVEIELLGKVSWCLESKGLYKQAAKASEREVHMSRDFYGKKNESTLNGMSNLAYLLAKLGKYREAEELHRQAIELRRFVPGAEDETTLTSMSLLADALSQRGNLTEAEELNRRILSRRETLLGLNSPDTIISKSKLAAVLSRQGKYGDAEAMHRQVLKSRVNELGPDDLNTLASKTHLALALKNQKKYAAAEEILRECLKSYQELRGPEHPFTLTTMNHLGTLLHCRGNEKEAEEVHRQTLLLREKSLGPEHHRTLVSMSNLALVLNSVGNLKEAEGLQRRALKGLERVEGLRESHDNILTGMANLVCICLKKGTRKDSKKAGDLARQVFNKMKEDASETHPDTLASLNNLTLVYLGQGRLQEAENIGLKVFEIARHELGDQHGHTLDSEANLASIRERQQGWKDDKDTKVPHPNMRKRELNNGDVEDSNKALKRQKLSELR